MGYPTAIRKPFNPIHDLLGDFSDMPNGKPELRISESNGEYFAQIWDDDAWYRTEKIEVPSNDDLKFLFKENMVPKIEAALMSKEAAFGIFKVEKDFEVAGDKVNSEYVGLLLFPMELYKL